MTMIGARGAAWRNCSMAASPSMPGSRTSSTIASGRRCRAAGMALLRRGGRGRRVPQLLGQLRQSPADALFVVDDQHVGHGRGDLGIRDWVGRAPGCRVGRALASPTTAPKERESRSAKQIQRTKKPETKPSARLKDINIPAGFCPSTRHRATGDHGPCGRLLSAAYSPPSPFPLPPSPFRPPPSAVILRPSFRATWREGPW